MNISSIPPQVTFEAFSRCVTPHLWGRVHQERTSELLHTLFILFKNFVIENAVSLKFINVDRSPPELIAEFSSPSRKRIRCYRVPTAPNYRVPTAPIPPHSTEANKLHDRLVLQCESFNIDRKLIPEIEEKAALLKAEHVAISPCPPLVRTYFLRKAREKPRPPCLQNPYDETFAKPPPSSVAYACFYKKETDMEPFYEDTFPITDLLIPKDFL